MNIVKTSKKKYTNVYKNQRKKCNKDNSIQTLSLSVYNDKSKSISTATAKTNNSKSCSDIDTTEQAFKEFLKTHNLTSICNPKGLTKQQESYLLLVIIKFFSEQITTPTSIGLTNIFNGTYSTAVYVQANPVVNVNSVTVSMVTMIPQATTPYNFSLQSNAFDVNNGNLLTTATINEAQVPRTSALAIKGPNITFQLNSTLNFIPAFSNTGNATIGFDVRMFLLLENENVYRYTNVGKIVTTKAISAPTVLFFGTDEIKMKNLSNTCFAILVINSFVSSYTGATSNVVTFTGNILSGSVLPLTS